ncbi:hypothetical protein AJ80_00780 [Polytolypa hystricis UAMH7299]|uniref:Galactose oxidase n=1 Tax=Polytolypa hystricis (strain UAMH7299) TaxID=1447883 RepID=A0A2B7Z2S3_POLH7|nr:hypothetical protein AJ80_00780 [Polytolypa hystricis UAMH7299]
MPKALHLSKFLLGLLWCQTVGAIDDFPYNPSFVSVAETRNPPVAYILKATSSTSNKIQLQSLSLKDSLDVSSQRISDLPVTGSSISTDDPKAFIPVIDDEGSLKLYAGDCQTNSSEVWNLVLEGGDSKETARWQRTSVSRPEEEAESLQGPNYLSAAVSYSPTNETTASNIYVFGGMCPQVEGESEDWVSTADYSQAMVSITANNSSSDAPYEAASIKMRSSPVAEAGFTMTPLMPAYSNTSSGKQLRQQSFVLFGGHTQQAFINTSQIALFSLPETSWSFIPVSQDNIKLQSGATGEEVLGIEPRSGHTAVLSTDGTKITVFGGWVGDTNVPAQPQLAILEVGEDYGGDGPWKWRVPSQNGPGIEEGTGIFGHGVAMLPGDVMLVAGGYSIPKLSSKRSNPSPSTNDRMFLYNVTSETWIAAYTAPSQSGTENKKSSGPLSSSSQKAGLGAGLGIGLSTLVVGLIFVYCIRSRRSREHRRMREQELRKLALGAERPHHDVSGAMAEVQDGGLHGLVQAGSYPPMGAGVRSGNGWRESGSLAAERTGLLVEVPSPTRGLRRSMHSSNYQAGPRYENLRGSRGIGNIHPIDEGEEDEELVEGENLDPSTQRHSKASIVSDPFVDPPSARQSYASAQSLLGAPSSSVRALEEKAWLEGIRMPPSSNNETRSISPDKSDRTLSNLSESSSSNLSMSSQSSRSGYLNRNLAHMLGLRPHSAASSSINYEPVPDTSLENHDQILGHSETFTRYNDNTGYSDRTLTQPHSPSSTSFSQLQVEGRALLSSSPAWAVPREPSTKMTEEPEGRRHGWIGNVRRALGSVRMAEDIPKSFSVSPEPATITRQSPNPGSVKSYYSLQNEGVVVSSANTDIPRRTVSASSSILRRKQGAKDWGAQRNSIDGTNLYRSRNFITPELSDNGTGPSGGGNSPSLLDYDDDEDWDVEAAAEGRSVQVTYTVPKEKLRVVNVGVGDDKDDDSISPENNIATNRNQDPSQQIETNQDHQPVASIRVVDNH